ncbi:LytR/AlgR family response regulator transcription factor [Geofilum sp. OHC36d9]|uniref:LytR/AlgR family response regulator transcription factor n=1 Tax=Geofilum sp. OHC36d9 TaxID=3458413 RepID=UPI00403441C2
MSIKCLIIDDERLAREYLKNYISKIPQLELLGEFNSPLKAINLIKSGEVDLLFLDIQMPDITGVDFLRTLSQAPDVIFTTAYQEYALEGFNLNVTDYLLKPFSFERFLQAVNKVLDKADAGSRSDNVQFPNSPETSIAESYLTIRADRKLYKINFSDLHYIEGQKAYVTFHTVKGKITALASLKELEESLPDSQFLRIHKSYIVATREIVSLEGNILEVGHVKLPVGKMYKEKVLNVFNVKL